MIVPCRRFGLTCVLFLAFHAVQASLVGRAHGIQLLQCLCDTQVCRHHQNDMARF